ncbi:hypothetical protein ACFVYJ_07740 [Pontibacter sp. JAM-7]|uniref:hypothetical protein n=1 Tax=Pontibacter sp. JAM-7 TaxID=3366581 RepID=UPI003AF5CF7C
MPDTSTAQARWLEQYRLITTLQQAIISTIRQQDENLLPELEKLVQQQDQAIRALPFDALTAADIDQLGPQISQLQQDHQTLLALFIQARQQLQQQSSKLKHSGRSIKAYHQTQDI